MLWQKLLVEWGAQIWRLLWTGAPLSALLEKITWQRVVFVAALLVAAIAFAQIVSLDVAFFMAGDVALYCEIAAAVMFVVVRGHIRQSVHTAKLGLTHATRRALIWCRRGTRARRRRAIKSPTSNGTDDDGDVRWLPHPPYLCFAAQP